MTLDFLQVLFTVLSLVLLMIPGYVLVKTKVLGEKADKALSGVVLYGLQPFLMIVGFQKCPFNPQIGVNMAIVFGLAVAIHLIMIGLVFLVFRGNEPRKNCMRFASVFSNCGYMGLPFVQMLFSGNPSLMGEILIYGSVIIAVFNILTWTIGIFMMTGDEKQISLKHVLINPVIICVVIGAILFFAVQVPLVDLFEEGTVANLIMEKFMGCIELLAQAVTPLSMIVIGVKLANAKPKEIVTNKYAYVSSLMKLIVMSLISILLVCFLPIDKTVKYALFFLLSMPSATATTLFAVRFGGDGQTGAISVLLSTILSIATIPLMFLIFSSIIGT